MKAGFYESDITPFIDTLATGRNRKKGIQTPFSYSAGVFEADGKCAALVGGDMIGLDRGVYDAALNDLKQLLPLDALVVGASHTHANPESRDRMISAAEIRAISDLNPEIRGKILMNVGRIDDDYRILLRKRLVDAVFTAYQRREEVRLITGRARVDNVAYNRRQKMRDGFTVTHAGKGNPDIVDYAGPVDTELLALGAVNNNGEMIGSVVNFGCHATVVQEEFFSADWPGYMRQTVKRNINAGMTVVFLNGCCGDVTQIDNLSFEEEPRTDRRAMVLGERVGFGAVEALRAPLPESFDSLKFNCEHLRLNYRDIPEARYRKALNIVNTQYGANRWEIGYYQLSTVLLKHKMRKQPFVDCELNAVQIGNLLLLTAPGEMFARLSLDLKAVSPLPFTMVAELVNGCIGYVPTPDVFESGGGGYEGRLGDCSCVEKEAFVKIRDKLKEMAKKFTPERAPEKPAPRGKPWIAYRPNEL